MSRQTANGFQETTSTADLYIIDTESYEIKDKIKSKHVNNAMLSLNNCLRSLYEINTGIHTSNHIDYD